MTNMLHEDEKTNPSTIEELQAVQREMKLASIAAHQVVEVLSPRIEELLKPRLMELDAIIGEVRKLKDEMLDQQSRLTRVLETCPYAQNGNGRGCAHS